MASTVCGTCSHSKDKHPHGHKCVASGCSCTQFRRIGN